MSRTVTDAHWTTVTHYHFPDGYDTTSEAEAVDHLHEILDGFEPRESA